MDQKIIHCEREPFKFELGNGRRIDEIVRDELGNTYVCCLDDQYYVGKGAFVGREVYAIPVRRTRPKHNIMVKFQPETIAGPDEVILKYLEDLCRKGDLDPLVNGIEIIDIWKKKEKERIERGKFSDEVLLGHIGSIRFEACRYVYATPENKKKLEEIFGDVF